MAIFPFGAIIKNRREELGLTQEDLADGICAVPTLSRIENGERMPTKNHYEMLMQRLGYSALSLDFFTDKRDFELHELKFRMRQSYVEQDYSLTEMLLREFIQKIDPENPIDEQFAILYEVLLHKPKYTAEQRLEKLEYALLLTCPKYKEDITTRILSYEEIILLNNIAICYDSKKNTEQAIAILTGVKNYYANHVVNAEEALRTQPMVLYNLSKYLGNVGRLDECIETCDLGIRIARKTSRCQFLHCTLLNRAWALIKRNDAGDRDAAQISLKQAYYFAVIMNKFRDADAMNAYYKQNFGEELSI